MGLIIRFRARDHVRASISTGHKSGRSSLLEIPVSRSIGSTNSAGTPRLDRVSQYQTCDCVVPIRSARGFCPPTVSHARLSASADVMSAQYSFLGGMQPKNLCPSPYLEFGIDSRMDSPIDPVEFGKRLKQRRVELGLSQTQVGKTLKERGLRGYSQQNIGSLENGTIIKDPRRQALDLAGPLQTTPEWLLYGRGTKDVAPPMLTAEEYSALPVGMRRAVSAFVAELQSRRQSA